MKTKKLNFRSKQVRHIEKDAAMLLLWTLVLVLMPNPGTILVALLIGSMIIANLQKFFFEESSFVYFFWLIIAILPIGLFALTGFLWYEQMLPLFWRNLPGIVAVALSVLALLGVVLDLIWRVFILRWDNRVIKDLLKQVPS